MIPNSLVMESVFAVHATDNDGKTATAIITKKMMMEFSERLGKQHAQFEYDGLGTVIIGEQGDAMVAHHTPDKDGNVLCVTIPLKQATHIQKGKLK